MLFCWPVHSPARFPYWCWRCCLLWGSPHFPCAHRGLPALRLGWQCRRCGFIARRLRCHPGVVFRHGRRPGSASQARGLGAPAGAVVRAGTPLENFEVNLMDFEVAGPGEAPPPTRPNHWAPWEPRLFRGIAHNFETGCWVGQEHLRHWEEEEFNFLIEFFCLFLEEPTIGSSVSGKTINSGMCSSRSGTRLLLPRQRPRSLSPSTSAPHSFLPGRDAEGELAAAVEEGILEAAKQASLEIRTKGAQKVNSWFKSTDLWGPAVCPAPAGHGMYCPADYPCRTQQDSELQELKDQMQ